MHNSGISSRRNRSLSWTEKASTPSLPIEVVIPNPNRTTSSAAHRTRSFDVHDPPTSAQRISRNRSNSADGLLNLYEEPTNQNSRRRRTSDRSEDRPPNKNGNDDSRIDRNYHSRPAFILYDEMKLQQSSASLDAAVELAASRLGVASPHSNHYCYQVQSNSTTTNSSSSRIRREERLREREVQRQQSFPFARSNTSMEAAPGTATRAYTPSMQCNPVSPIVLQNLPTIVVRSEDFYPEDVIANSSSHLERCMDALSIEDNGYASSGSLSIGLDALATYSCTICCEDIEVGTTAVRLPCAHLYHADCIVTWLSKFNTCPPFVALPCQR
jgi:Ring finger domain